MGVEDLQGTKLLWANRVRTNLACFEDYSLQLGNIPHKLCMQSPLASGGMGFSASVNCREGISTPILLYLPIFHLASSVAVSVDESSFFLEG